MASGTFTTMNKKRPGLYSNFISGKKQVGVAANGTIAMTEYLNWGTPREMLEITAQTNLFETLGATLEDDEMKVVREALKTAQTVLLYNLASDGTYASGQITDTVKIEAVKMGIYGNQILVIIEEQTDSSFDVITYFRNRLVDTQNVISATDFKSNRYISLIVTGDASLTENTGITLTGGATGSTVDATDFFEKLEQKEFYAFAFHLQDPMLYKLGVAQVKKWRDQDGKKVIFVTGNTGESESYEGIVQIYNGVVLANNEEISSYECAAYVAGAMASAGINRSLTYFEYENAIDIEKPLSNLDIETALDKGYIIFTKNQNRIVIEQDINSLIDFSETKNRDFRKNKFIRVIDTLHNELLRIWSTRFIGQITNNEDGRELLKKDILALLSEFQNNGAIEEYDSSDVEIIPGDDKDTVIVNLSISITDAMEKMYLTVVLN